jgi:ABC-type protease/lipase transport system fused ATPase/permease subunit
MPRTCTVCPHHRDEIDRLLLAGTPLRNIAKQFSLSSASLFRHNTHMSKVLSNARQEAEILRADGLMEQLNHLWTETARLTQKAEQRKDLRTALAGVREKSRLLEPVMRVAVEMRQRTFSEFVLMVAPRSD